MTTRATHDGAGTVHAFPWAPASAFVLVWSSGYIAGPAGVEAAPPFALLTARFVLATIVLALLARWRRGPLRMDARTLVRVALVGVTMNACVFGLMYLAFDAGLGATLGALLHSLSPVLTVVLAGLVLREPVRRAQVAGLAAGVAGVGLVLGPELDAAGGTVGVTLGLASMLALSLGTMGQRWVPAAVDPWWSATVQFAVCIPPLALASLLLERGDSLTDPVNGAIALVWLAVVNSVVGLVLLGAVVRRGGAGAASSVFFLAPPVTALLAWLALGDTLGPRELVGLAVASAGVALAVRPARRPGGPAARARWRP